MRFSYPVICSLFLGGAVLAGSTSETWIRGSNPDEIHLYRNGRHVGGYRYSTQEWYPFDPNTRTWGEPIKQVPWEMSPLEQPKLQNFGVSPDRSDHERWVVDGKELLHSPMPEEPSVIPDDGSLSWLVWVGDPAIGERIRQDLTSSPALAPYNKVRFQSYSLEDLMVRDRDGKLCYQIGLTKVNPDRKPQWNLKEYRGPEDLAGMLRKLPPDYDPAKVPDLSAVSSDLPLETPLSVPAGGLALLSALGSLWLLKKQ